MTALMWAALSKDHPRFRSVSSSAASEEDEDENDEDEGSGGGGGAGAGAGGAGAEYELVSMSRESTAKAKAPSPSFVVRWAGLGGFRRKCFSQARPRFRKDWILYGKITNRVLNLW